MSAFARARFSFLKLTTLAAILLAVVLVACSDAAPSGPAANPLEGLSQTTRGDTATPPASTTPTTPGSFNGRILGYTPGPGADTLGTAEPLVGVKVTAFVRTEANGETAAGSQVATTTTDATGHFQLPMLAGGEYVVTFVVPQGSIYRSGWTVGFAWENSNASPWFIMLRKV